MRRGFAWLAAAPATALVVLAAVLGGAEQDAEKQKSPALPPLKVDRSAPSLPGGPPPLEVDHSAPLLLDGPAGKKSVERQAGPMADNTACYVCHANYQEEQMAAAHAKANVGCVKCHGPSVAHRNDEANVTPPDIIYPAAKIDAACGKCHDTHDAAATKVLARWQDRCARRLDPKRIVCTDCHGEHRMKMRTVHWDKDTRKLLGAKPQGWLTGTSANGSKTTATPSSGTKAK
jgi:hypothetical protein